ncbi:neurotrypsin-like [Amphiura filiformis]|uniref:neurotrypsin-like n=1 Tax=Amphiura filiformis TaxID=82378 RepID=UPI003B21EB9D
MWIGLTNESNWEKWDDETPVNYTWWDPSVYWPDDEDEYSDHSLGGEIENRPKGHRAYISPKGWNIPLPTIYDGNKVIGEFLGYICEKQASRPPTSVPPESGMENGDFKLLYGADSSEGILHVVYKNEIGTVCDDHFDDVDAGVACRNLGYAGGIMSFLSDYGYAGKGRIWLDDIFCEGDESSIADCRHNPWGVSGCTHHEDVALKCFQEDQVPCDGYSDVNAGCPQTTFRLVSTSSSSTIGALQFYKNNKWGYICDYGFAPVFAINMVCKHFGYSGGFGAFVDPNLLDFSRDQEGNAWFGHIRCTGEEDSLDDCIKDPLSAYKPCPHNNGVQMISCEP